MMNSFRTLHTNQKGAIFGLDARITLAIFTIISVISAATLTLDTHKISSGALTDEIRGMGDAVEGLHSDLKIDLYKALIKPNPENAFLALIQDDVIKVGMFRSRWIGPYLKHLSNVHPKYGKMRIEKKGQEHSATCHVTSGCYLWLTMDTVQENIVDGVNGHFDGAHEGNPRLEGRIQWSKSDTSERPDEYKLWYRIAPAIN